MDPIPILNVRFMKKTENEIMLVLEKIIHDHPQVVVGGSISLLARGFLNRPPGDIDLIVENYRGILNSKMLGESENVGSQNIDMIDGQKVTRMSIDVGGVQVCIFRVCNTMLASELLTYKGVTFKAQIPVYQIKAKQVYSLKGYEKHTTDLESIFQKIGETVI
jgi:hypothetical protein